MVTVGRYRDKGKKGPDSTVGRYSARFPCTVGRCYQGGLCTVRRYKACVFHAVSGVITVITSGACGVATVATPCGIGFHLRYSSSLVSLGAAIVADW